MKNLTRRFFAVVLSLLLCFSVVFGIDLSVQSATVDYVYSGNYIKNWGVREEVATFLSQNAEAFYKDNGTSYEELSALSGSKNESSIPTSTLYKKLQSLMKLNHSYETSYADTRPLFQHTDCENSGKTSKKISSFYSGTPIGPSWDYGETWNREHTWPNSKGDLAGNGENDLMMLRPASASENTSRSNIAYGQSSGYYNPNSESGGKHDLRGDVARIMLYQYVRWNCINTGSKYNPNGIFGTKGVIESAAVMLDWIEEDPVDTWELGRNDSVESITGTRNVFVDYPELAFILFGEEVPKNYITPSGSASDGDIGDNTNPDTPVVPDVKPEFVVADVFEVGKAYKFGVDQTNLGKLLFATGETQGYYMATTEDVSKAVDVYLEDVSGGYCLYAMVNGTKKYMNIVMSGRYVNAVYSDAATTVFDYDASLKTFVTDINNSTYAFGTYNTFTTIGTGDIIKYPDNFFARLYVEFDYEERPENPEDVLFGDVNEDGYINNKDLAAFMQYLNGWTVVISQKNSDVNCDGNINNKDYGLLMQFVNNWDVILGSGNISSFINNI